MLDYDSYSHAWRAVRTSGKSPDHRYNRSVRSQPQPMLTLCPDIKLTTLSPSHILRLTPPCVHPLFFFSSFFLVRWFVLKVFLQGSSTDFLTRPQVRLDRLAGATRKRTVATLASMAGEPPVVVLFKRIYAGTAGGCATLLHLILPWVR